MRAIANLNNAYHDVIETMDVANTALAEGKDSLVERFTFSDEWDAYEDQMKRKKDQQVALVFAAGSIFAALASFPPVTAAVAGIGFGTAAAKTILATFQSLTFAASNSWNLLEQVQSLTDKTDTGM